MSHTVDGQSKRAQYIAETLAETTERWFSRESDGAQIDLSEISQLSTVAYETYDSIHGQCLKECHDNEREEIIGKLNAIWERHDLPLVLLDLIVATINQGE